MATVQTQTRQRQRFLSVFGPVLTIRQQRSANKWDEASYFVEEIGSDDGRGFRLSKLAGGTDPESETYEVEIVADGGLCCCKGFYRWGRCSHLDATRKLIELGKI